MSEYGHIFELGHNWTKDREPLKNRYTVVYENKDYYVCVTGGDTQPRIIRKSSVYSLESMRYAIEHGDYDFTNSRYVFVKKAKDFDIKLPTNRNKYLKREIEKYTNAIQSSNEIITRYQNAIADNNRNIQNTLVSIAEKTATLEKLKKLYQKELESYQKEKGEAYPNES